MPVRRRENFMMKKFFHIFLLTYSCVRLGRVCSHLNSLRDSKSDASSQFVSEEPTSTQQINLYCQIFHFPPQREIFEANHIIKSFAATFVELEFMSDTDTFYKRTDQAKYIEVYSALLCKEDLVYTQIRSMRVKQ